MPSDDADRRAREVVGLYGDPESTWGIAAEFALSPGLDPEPTARSLEELHEQWPHLGPAADLDLVDGLAWEERRGALASASFSPGSPLVRVALEPAGTRLLVVAHHGVCDGLGLVAIAAALTPGGLDSRARGIGDRPATRSFLRSGMRRLAEAGFDPPPRFDPRPGEAGAENVLALPLPRLGVGTANLGAAVGEVFREWNGLPADSRVRPLIVVGASRREQGALAPDRRTAYLRLRLEPGATAVQIADAMRATAPEPDFPETSGGGIGPRITHLLRHRLGATAQLSNLGVIEAPALQHVAMFPALAGPQSVAVGLASTASTTTLSVRTRATEFSHAATQDLLDRLAAALRRAGQ